MKQVIVSLHGETGQICEQTPAPLFSKNTKKWFTRLDVNITSNCLGTSVV